MLEVLIESDEIDRAMARFHKRFVDASDHAVIATVGYPGGIVRDKVYEFQRFGHWYCPHDFGVDFNRHWNGFGSDTPHTMASMAIDVEINFPKVGINRSIAGAFAIDRATEALFVVHRGKIGGGRKGVSKSAFWKHYRGVSEMVQDGDHETQVAMLGSLNSPRFIAQIVDFVTEVKRIKAFVTSHTQKDDTDSNDDSDESPAFTPEFAGSKFMDMPAFIEAKCDHGLVVNRLAGTIEQAGYHVANDRHRDLYIVGRNIEIRMLFEVKTDNSLTSIQQALGQLMLHGRAIDANTQLVIVAPKNVDTEIASRLKALDVHLLQYSWAIDVPEFPNLAKLIAKPTNR